jgi:hypothetical protein
MQYRNQRHCQSTFCEQETGRQELRKMKTLKTCKYEPCRTRSAGTSATARVRSVNKKQVVKN